MSRTIAFETVPLVVLKFCFVRAIDDEIYRLLRYILPLILFLSLHYSSNTVCMVHGHLIYLSYEEFSMLSSTGIFRVIDTAYRK